MSKSGSKEIQEATVIFPNQLFENHPGLSKEREVFLIEENKGIILTFDFIKRN